MQTDHRAISKAKVKSHGKNQDATLLEPNCARGALPPGADILKTNKNQDMP
jgi:hypothetical protein